MPFSGRGKDLDAVTARFEEGARLVTLLGPAGIGKTALAREVAKRSGCARFVDLEGAVDAHAVDDRVRAACGADARELGEALVVLDDFPRSARAGLERWLDATNETRFLVTTTERIGLDEEIVHELGPVEREDGVAILVAAARRTNNVYAPAPVDAPILAEIAARLDGVPLALDLAGARLPLLGPRGLLERVRAEGAGLDDLVRRSLDGLSAEERDALAALAAFRGGFTVETAAAVSVTPRIIEALLARSLVRTRDPAAARFDLYAQVRSFVVRERRFHAAREQHDAWFVARAEDAARRAHADPEARSWLLREREDILAVALGVMDERMPSAGAAERALRALVALHPVLAAHGIDAQIADAVAPVVDRTSDSGADPRLAARAMLLRAALRRRRGDLRAALKDGLGAESIARAVGDALLTAEAGFDLGRTVLASGEIDAARTHFDRASRAFAALGARAREAEALALLGAITGASALVERAVAIADAQIVVRVLLYLAWTRAQAGDATGAVRAIDDALARGADVRERADAEILRGLALHDAGELDAGAASLARARDHALLHGMNAHAAIARGHLGVVAREAGRAAEAYALLADARDTLREDDHGAYFELHLSAIRDGAADAVHLRTRDPLAMPSALLERIVKRASRPAAAAPPEDALLVGAGGAWFRAPGGARVGLERRRSLALLLDRLAVERLERPSSTLSSAALFAAAWPGEKAIPSAAAHRVRVAVATLRKMGLRELLVTTPEGYSLAFDRPLMRV